MCDREEISQSNVLICGFMLVCMEAPSTLGGACLGDDQGHGVRLAWVMGNTSSSGVRRCGGWRPRGDRSGGRGKI